ncbi:MAG: membrane protein insertion efficiency factor YidD [Chloroflexia bacterium]
MLRKPVLWMIRGYQRTLARMLPPDTCRFYPTCSHYGYEAIQKYGVIKGGGMAVWRVMRCNPWSKGGHDPVP